MALCPQWPVLVGPNRLSIFLTISKMSSRLSQHRYNTSTTILVHQVLDVTSTVVSLNMYFTSQGQ